MKIDNVMICGFHPAMRGMRAAHQSWNKIDSLFGGVTDSLFDGGDCPDPMEHYWLPEYPFLGPNDLHLASSLVKAGDEHSKFTRLIQVWADLTLPLYVWTEFDTYKVGVTRLSTSTMHSLHKRELMQSDFEGPILGSNLEELNLLVRIYQEYKDSLALENLKNALPAGFLYTSTVSFNYQVARHIYFQRCNHKLLQWNESNPNSICSWITTLPYARELITIEK